MKKKEAMKKHTLEFIFMTLYLSPVCVYTHKISHTVIYLL